MAFSFVLAPISYFVVHALIIPSPLTLLPTHPPPISCAPGAWVIRRSMDEGLESQGSNLHVVFCDMLPGVLGCAIRIREVPESL